MIHGGILQKDGDRQPAGAESETYEAFLRAETEYT